MNVAGKSARDGWLLFAARCSRMFAYTMSVVRPDERSAAAGVTAVARSVGASISPMLATVFVGNSVLMSLPFLLAGGLKIIYDLLLYRAFSSSKSSPLDP